MTLDDTLALELEQVFELAKTRPKMQHCYLATSKKFLGFCVGDILWSYDRQCWNIMFYTEQVGCDAKPGELGKVFMGELRSLGY